jgi:hypothetical protein
MRHVGLASWFHEMEEKMSCCGKDFGQVDCHGMAYGAVALMSFKSAKRDHLPYTLAQVCSPVSG